MISLAFTMDGYFVKSQGKGCEQGKKNHEDDIKLAEKENQFISDDLDKGASVHSASASI